MGAGTGIVTNSVVQMGPYQREVIDNMFTRVDVDWPNEARARFVVSRPGDLVLVRSKHFAPNSRSRRLQRHMSGTDGRHYFLLAPFAGSVRIRRLGRDFQVQSGDVAVVATDEEYEIEMSDHLDAAWMRIPADVLRAHALSVHRILGRPLDARGGIGRTTCEMLASVLTEENAFSQRAGRLLAQALTGFVGELINANVGLETSASTLRRHKILARACDFIDAHLEDEDLNPQAIAQGVGISARYLSELFAAQGTTPMRWLQKRRLEKCRAELERSRGAGRQLICEIAYSMGFANISSFNRAFKAHFGRSHSEFLGAAV